MSTTFRNCRRGLSAVAVAAFVIGGGAAIDAQSGVPQEGVKVVGEWTIVVRDEAGKEIQRSEFRNALQDQGKPTLAGMLSRTRAIGDWVILMTNSSGQHAGGAQPCGTASAGLACGLVERISSQLQFTNSVDYVTGLTVGVDPNDSSKVVLSGSRKATNNSYITTVSTMLGLCPPGPPSATGCASTQHIAYFSGTRNFTNPPQVAAGQTIDVTVVFSFQ